MKRSVAIKATVMVFMMVVISALTVGGAVLISGQNQYDEQNFGILDIQTRRFEEEIIHFFSGMDQISSLFYNIPISQITADKIDPLVQNYKNIKFIQIFSKNGTLIQSMNYSTLKGNVDSLYPKGLERPITLSPGRGIYSPQIATIDGVHDENPLSVMRLKIDKGSTTIMIGIDIAEHFKRFDTLQGDSSELILFNKKGQIIYHPNRIKRLSHVSKIAYSIKDEFPKLDTKEFFNHTNHRVNKTLTDYRKESVYLFYRQVNYKNHFLVAMAYTVPTINLPSFIRSFDSKHLFSVALLICLLPLLSWPMLKYLFRDLKEITYKAQQYTNGEHDIIIDVHSQDEIGVLALTFQGMIRQVNERTRYLRKSERRIREARDQAEQALSSKSHLLEDLREQKSEIERVSKDKDDLLAIVSHDLKNPLAVIETSMDVIMEEEKENLSGVSLDLVRRSKNSARTALSLITDLLDLARLEGGIKLDFEKFSVEDLLENVVDSYYLKAKEKNIQVEIHHHKDFELIADYGRVVQILSNILGNALKFTPHEGRINIEVESYETQQSYEGTNQGLEIKITDTGPGIPEDKLLSIFDKFEQARANDRKIGTGLGLAIVKNICELHNGNIAVESVEGSGSTFIIRLPRLLMANSNEVSVSEEAKTIFIANDDELFRKRIKKIFSDSSYKVAEATNGEELLLYLDKHTPDLIILDHDMPVKDGLSAWKEFTQSSDLNIPVILLSDSVEGVDPEWLRNHIYDIVPANSSAAEIENRTISILNPNLLSSLDKRLDPQKKTVLIVDDEEAIRTLLHEVICMDGYNGIIAKNGVEALFLVQKYRIDLVVSDIRMSEGDGILLTKAIKKDYPTIPVALMSAAIDGISENVADKIGVERLITKPFDIDAFSGYIKDIIGTPSFEKETNIFRKDSRNTEPDALADTSHSGDKEVPIMSEAINEVEIQTHNENVELNEHSEEALIKIDASSKVIPAEARAKILLVDDSADMQVLFKLLLRKENIDLDIVDNGRDAVEKIKKLSSGEYYDTIFMDLNMPNMNGDEATDLIRKWEKAHNQIPQRVVLLSASSKEQAIGLMDKGFDSFIQKPINKAKILDEVNQKKAS